MPNDPDVPEPSAELLRRWQEDGDPAALNDLLQIEVGLLKQMIRGKRSNVLAGSASTSDIAQEAVMGLLKTRSAPTFSDPRALRGYLWRSAWHLLVKRFDKKSKSPMRVDLEDPLKVDRFLRSAQKLQDIDREERALAIGLAMNLLSRDDREILRLVYFEGRDIATAGAAVGLTRVVANGRLVRARRLLASRLTEWSGLIG